MVLNAAEARLREALVRKRAAIKSKLTQFKNFLDEQEVEPDNDALRAHLGWLEKAFEPLQEITSQLQEIEPEVDHYAEEAMMDQEYAKALTRYYKLQGRAMATIAAASPAPGIPASPNPFASSSTLTRLPEQTLPKFSGRYEDWLSFQDDFQSTIGRRPGLSDTEKGKYLRSCLSGEPERLVRKFETTDEGYRNAWALLKKIFENKNRIRERHVTEILNIPTMQKESAQNLSEVINTLELHCASLESLGENTFSTMMLCIALTKIDKSTCKQWRMSLKEDELPTYDQLISFLRRMVSLTPDDASNVSKDGSSHGQGKGRNGSQNGQSGKAPKQSPSFVTTTSHECPMCKGNHQLFQCQEFKKLTPKERFHAATRISACINCLRSGHSVRQCTSNFTCKMCHKKHHTWLHFSESPQQSSEANGATQAATSQA